MRRIGLLTLMVMPCCQAPGYGQTSPARPAGLDAGRVTALAKMYFRDSAELPMDVAVTTVVTDARGKLKRRSQSSVRFVFRGYNQEAGKFSFRSNSGWFNTRALRESLSGDLAVFAAAMRLAPAKDWSPHLEIQQPAQPGEPFLVSAKDGECPEFKLLRNWVFPEKLCISAQFRLAGDPANDLVFQHFSFDVTNLPATAKVADFGDVQVLSFHSEGDFQKASLPGEAQPYLLPKQVVTSVATSKGKMVITNQYAPRIQKTPAKR
jgi:hypothetical protein